MKTGERRSDPPAATNASDQGEADPSAILAEISTESEKRGLRFP
jgi:hypothetical protein